MAHELVINSKTDADIKRFLKRPAQFLILVGPEGSGKFSLAKQIGGELLGVSEVDKHPQLLNLGLLEGKSEIAISQVREVIVRFKFRTTGEGSIRRLLIIKDGQYLSHEAQNALLKTLEEPPADTQIIMTLDAPSSVFPTIISRGEVYEVQPIDKITAQKLAKNRSQSDVESAWLLAEGRAGLIHALLDDSETHELKSAVSDAKRFLAGGTYERLIAGNEFTKDRKRIELLLEGLQRVIKIAQTQSISNGKQTSQDRFLAARRLLEELRAASRSNVSPRAVYLRLCLNLGL